MIYGKTYYQIIINCCGVEKLLYIRMSFIWFLILDFEDPWFKLILKAQIMYLREIYKNFPQKKKGDL